MEGGGDKQGVRKCQINCKMMTGWAVPGCDSWLLPTPVTRREEMTLSRRGQWSP